MAKKLKPWKQLTIGEQNYYYYVYKGYSKMTNPYHMEQSYWKECEKREKKERKAEEKKNVSYYDY